MDFIIPFLFIIILALFVVYIVPGIEKKMPEPQWRKERRRSDENEERKRNIVAKWETKFGPEDVDWDIYFDFYREDFLIKYDRVHNEFERKSEYLSRIRVENIEKVRTLEGEIDHYGDTINVDDNEYISRMNEIRRLRREIPTVELELRDIRTSLNQIENDIKRYDRESAQKHQDYFKRIADEDEKSE